jgi:hypothetical protein
VRIGGGSPAEFCGGGPPSRFGRLRGERVARGFMTYVRPWDRIHGTVNQSKLASVSIAWGTN